jgi:DedD protein
MDSNDTEISTTTELSQLRRQARQRFLGTAVLVLIAVIALPFVLDTKPRPVAADIAVEIQAPTAPTVTPTPALVAPPPPITQAAAVPDQPAPLQSAAPTEAAKPEPSKSDDGARAVALLNATGYQIQAGSFTDKSKLAAVQNKLSQAGFENYTQDAIAKDGTPHVRVRLGPFATQVEANSVAARIAKLGIKTIVIKP